MCRGQPQPSIRSGSETGDGMVRLSSSTAARRSNGAGRGMDLPGANKILYKGSSDKADDASADQGAHRRASTRQSPTRASPGQDDGAPRAPSSWPCCPRCRLPSQETANVHGAASCPLVPHSLNRRDAASRNHARQRACNDKECRRSIHPCRNCAMCTCCGKRAFRPRNADAGRRPRIHGTAPPARRR